MTHKNEAAAAMPSPSSLDLYGNEHTSLWCRICQARIANTVMHEHVAPKEETE